MRCCGVAAALLALAGWCHADTDQMTQDALSLDAHPNRGRPLFARHCALCHGAHALGDAQRGIPALAGQRYAYLIRQLANFSGRERDSTAMHAVTARVALQNPQSWADVAAYLNGMPTGSPLHPGSGHDVARGHEIYVEQCASCHATDGGGDADGFVPSLRHQHVEYLKSQMGKLAKEYRHNVDPELVKFLGGVEERDLAAVADYLSRLSGSGSDRKRMLSNGVVVD